MPATTVACDRWERNRFTFFREVDPPCGALSASEQGCEPAEPTLISAFGGSNSGRRLLFPERSHGLQSGRAGGWDVTGHERDCHKQDQGRGERDRIVGAQAIQNGRGGP